MSKLNRLPMPRRIGHDIDKLRQDDGYDVKEDVRLLDLSSGEHLGLITRDDRESKSRLCAG